MERRHFSFLFALELFYVKNCYTGTALNKFKTLDVSKGAPKVWNAYIRIFMNRYLGRTISHKMYVRSLIGISKYSSSFKDLNIHSVKISCHTAKTNETSPSNKFQFYLHNHVIIIYYHFPLFTTVFSCILH